MGANSSTLCAWSDHGTPPILDLSPWATTSPVCVAVAGKPMRSAGDAEYVLAWIDRAAEAARAHGGFNAEAGRARVLAQVAEARAEFERRAVR